MRSFLQIVCLISLLSCGKAVASEKIAETKNFSCLLLTDTSQLKSETVDFAPISDADFDVDEESITSQDSFDDVPLTGSFPLCLSHDFLNPFCYTYPKTIVRHSPAFPERTIPIYLSNRVLRI